MRLRMIVDRVFFTLLAFYFFVYMLFAYAVLKVVGVEDDVEEG